MKFSVKIRLMIILKVSKKQGFILSLSLKSGFLEKPHDEGEGGRGVQFEFRLFRVKDFFIFCAVLITIN